MYVNVNVNVRVRACHAPVYYVPRAHRLQLGLETLDGANRLVDCSVLNVSWACVGNLTARFEKDLTFVQVSSVPRFILQQSVLLQRNGFFFIELLQLFSSV